MLAFIFALLVFLFGWDGIRIAPAPPKAFRDFALMHTGAECFLDRCDPYSAEAAMHENDARGELKMDVDPDELMYPPSTFLLLTPLARSGWPSAGYVWCWLGVLLVALTGAAVVETLELERHPMALLPLFALVVSTPLHAVTGAAFNNNLHTGNPSLVAAPLVALACLMLLGKDLGSPGNGGRRTLGWALLGIALALKPQLAIGPVIALLLRKQTHMSAAKAASLAVAFFAFATAFLRFRLGSFAFLAHWAANNRLAMQPGHTIDSSLANPIGQDMLGLQRIAYVLGAPKPWPDVLAWGIVLCVIVAAVMINRRNGAWRRWVWCSVALCVLLSVMPVYHNKYDRLIALAVLPACAQLDTQAHKVVVWLLSAIAAFWVLSEQIFDHVLGRAARWPVNQAIPLVLCALLLWAMAQQQRDASDLKPAYA